MTNNQYDELIRNEFPKGQIPEDKRPLVLYRGEGSEENRGYYYSKVYLTTDLNTALRYARSSKLGNPTILVVDGFQLSGLMHSGKEPLKDYTIQNLPNDKVEGTFQISDLEQIIDTSQIIIERYKNHSNYKILLSKLEEFRKPFYLHDTGKIEKKSYDLNNRDF
jgi:hypothetical protein